MQGVLLSFNLWEDLVLVVMGMAEEVEGMAEEVEGMVEEVEDVVVEEAGALMVEFISSWERF